jgi:NAD(P)-dependent dehydrogenase (short-subunit alcohol dehydrogenase family)
MLNKKVAIVTGAASGIGRQTAFALAIKGAFVVLSDVDKKRLKEAEECIQTQGGTVRSKLSDISVESQAEDLIRFTVTEFGRLDIAVNNAGVGGEMYPTASYQASEWDRVLNVNLRGQWFCMKYEIAEMLKNGGGSIINVSSILGKVGFANAPAYTAAKHGLVGLTKAAALEYASEGIRVNAVAPGFILTPMLENAGILEDEDMQQQVVNLHPVGRLGRPEEVADAIIWLASEASSFVTGHTLMVDGGYTAR